MCCRLCSDSRESVPQPGRADPRKPSISPVNDVLSLSLLHQLASGNMAAVQQAMGGGVGGDKHAALPSSSFAGPASAGPRDPGQGGNRDADFGNEFFDDSPRFRTKPVIAGEATGKGGKGPSEVAPSLTQPRPMSHYSGEDDRLSGESNLQTRMCWEGRVATGV